MRTKALPEPSSWFSNRRSTCLQRDFLRPGLRALGQSDAEQAIRERGFHLLRVDGLRQAHDPLETAERLAVVQVPTALLRPPFAPDEEHAVLESHFHVIFRHAGQVGLDVDMVVVLPHRQRFGNLLSKVHGQPLKGKTPHELKLEGGDPWNASLQIALEIHKTQEACRSQIYDLKSFSQFGLGQESPIAAPADCRIGSVDDPDRMSK